MCQSRESLLTAHWDERILTSTIADWLQRNDMETYFDGKLQVNRLQNIVLFIIYWNKDIRIEHLTKKVLNPDFLRNG